MCNVQDTKCGRILKSNPSVPSAALAPHPNRLPLSDTKADDMFTKLLNKFKEEVRFNKQDV